jgi:hypothetical protein
MTAPVDPATCPLCGGPNDCQIAAGRTTCWCFEAPVPADVLARVPLAAQGVACVCRPCAKPPSGTVEHERRRRALRWVRR